MSKRVAKTERAPAPSSGSTAYSLWGAAGVGALFLYPATWESSQILGDPGHWPLLLSGALLAGILAIWGLRGTASPCTHSSGAALALTALLTWSLTGLPHAYVVSEWWGTVGRMGLYAGWLWAVGRLLAQQKIGISHGAAFGVGMAGVLAVSVLVDWKTIGWAVAWNDPYAAPGLLGHKNFTASALLVAAWGAFYHLNTPSDDRKWRLVAGGVGILAVLALALLRTRSIWLGAGLGLAVWAATSSTALKLTARRLAVPMGIFALLLGAALAQPKIRETLLDPQNLRIREVYWDHSLQMLQAHPWTGVGAGQWVIHFPGYGLNGMDPSVAEGITAEIRPHNDFLWVASEWGWPGLALWVLVWGTALWALWKSPKGTEKAYLAAVLVGVFVYSLFEFPLERAAVTLPWLLALAGVGQLAGTGPRISWIPSWATGGMALLLILPSAFILEQRRAGTEANADVLQANASQQASLLVSTATSAYSRWNEIDRYGNPLPYFQGMGALFTEVQQTSAPTFAQAEAHFRTALALHPNHIVTLNQMGNLYRYRGLPKEAIPHYLQALQRSRDFGSARLGLAECLLDLNRVDSAGRVLFESFGMSTNGTTQSVRQDPRYREAVLRWWNLSAGQAITYKPLQPLAGRIYESPEVAFAAFEAAKDAAMARELAKNSLPGTGR